MRQTSNDVNANHTADTPNHTEGALLTLPGVSTDDAAADGYADDVAMMMMMMVLQMWWMCRAV